MGQQKSSTKHSSKRSREASIEIVSTRPLKSQKRCAKYKAFYVPLDDADAYQVAVKRRHFLPIHPDDLSYLDRAKQNRDMNRVVLGIQHHQLIETMVLDKKTGLPWQVPKVTIEYKRVVYGEELQEYTEDSRGLEGLPVSPRTLPAVEQMTADEYIDAVEEGDVRIAPRDRCTYEFCQGLEAGWLPYKER